MTARMLRTSLAVVLCSGVVLGGSAFAAPAKLAKAQPLTVTDPSGDANGINSQFGQLPASPPEQSNESTSQKSADIVSFTLGRKDDGKTVKAFVGTLTLAAPPAQGTDYRIRMKTADCASYFLEYEFPPALGGSGEVRETCSGGTTATFDPVDATITGNTITWTIPVKGMPGTAKLGTVFTVLGAQTSVETAAIVPGLDQVLTNKTFVVGQ